MNEITRIHIAKTPYDIEVAAKKQLEKYIKSLELYTQDKEVLADIEIRITELLLEQGIPANGVIGSDDILAVRKQLGEPYEFAGDDGDIAVGAGIVTSSRRFYRSTDDAVLGGVLSGIAAYFGVNPLWTRLAFVVLLFISFGFASLVYILFWVITPAARTATEKLQLAGKGVTVESIKELSAEEEALAPNRVAPVLQRIFAVSLGVLSLLGAVAVFITTAVLAIAAATSNNAFLDMTNGFMGLGDGNAWIAWLVFGIVLFGMLLLTALLSLIAYAFLKRKLTKRMVVSGIVITVLGITSVAATIGISTTQSWRVANETRSMVRETKAHLPANFKDVKSVEFIVDKDKNKDNQEYFGVYPSIQYIVDEGPARYEFSALPTTKSAITVEGTHAVVSISTVESFRNSFVRPTLTVYGPALDSIVSDATQVDYTGVTQTSLIVNSKSNASISVVGLYETVEASGSGSISLDLSAIQSLTVKSEHNLSVSAGTVKNLSVTQPGVCSSGTYRNNTSVTLAEVTSTEMSYNGILIPAVSHETSCATVTIGTDEEYNTQSM